HLVLQRVFAPWSIQAPSSLRSAFVMCVAFESGMTCVSTATVLISCACALICDAVSSTIPFGGAVVRVGCREWQTAQRCATIGATWANATRGAPAAGAVEAGRIHTATAAIPAAAVSGIHHSVRPACRLLK